MTGWSQFKAILRKDLIRELRSMIVSSPLVLLAMVISTASVKEGDLTYFTAARPG
jgi:hypothetical protein